VTQVGGKGKGHKVFRTGPVRGGKAQGGARARHRSTENRSQKDEQITERSGWGWGGSGERILGGGRRNPVAKRRSTTGQRKEKKDRTIRPKNEKLFFRKGVRRGRTPGV